MPTEPRHHETSGRDALRRPLLRWMNFVLRFVAFFNVGAGLFMLIGYHETYKIIGMNKPDISFPIQLVGILVGLFGVGYYLVAKNPTENRSLLLLGFPSCSGRVWELVRRARFAPCISCWSTSSPTSSTCRRST